MAVILASSSGSRLYPLTVDAHDGRELDSDKEQDDEDDKEEVQGSADTAAVPFMPKHLLPVAGSPNIFHLLRRLHACHFRLVILTLSAHDPDTLTLRVLTEPSLGFAATVTQTLTDGSVMLHYQGMKIHMVRLVGECSGSADVLRILSCKINTATTTTTVNTTASTTDAATHVLPHNAHVMVLPGDLIVTPSSSSSTLEMEEVDDPIVLLADAHRKGAFPIHFSQYSTMKNGTFAALPSLPPPPTAALTMLLTNVGEEDETATPLKESAKAKKGGLAREDLDIEYIALSHIQHLHHIHTLTAAAASATIVNSFASSSSSLSSRAIASSSFAPIPSFATRAVPQRVILKTSKFAIEEDEENTGSTPKLIIPKARFHPNTIFQDMAPSAKSSFSIRNDWSDIHAYVFSPWVLHLLQARPAIKDIQKDLVPLLIARQFKGVKATFLGTHASSSHTFTTATTTTTTTMETLVDKEDRQTILDHVLAQDPTFQSHYSISTDERNQQQNHHRNSINTTMTSVSPPLTTTSTTTTTFTDRGQKQTINSTRDEQEIHSVDFPYLVNAQVLPRSTSKLTLRACTIPSYLYACREMASRACTTPEHVVNKKNPTATSSSIPFATLPHGTVIDTKTHSILLPDASMEDKVQIKSCTVGHRSKIGAKSRLNNVVIMDDVVIGENCVLQNSVISTGCIIGENSNLNDCQVGPKAMVSSGTKAKGESFTV